VAFAADDPVTMTRGAVRGAEIARLTGRLTGINHVGAGIERCRGGMPDAGNDFDDG
jgi:hypothetical protein